MQEQNRRQFFRIEHQVSVEIKLISEKDFDTNPRPVQFEVSPYFLLLTELQALDTDREYLLRKIAEKDSHIAGYLEIMNDKIQAISHAIAASSMDIEHLQSQEVNLSEGGMMLEYDTELDSDQLLAVKLVFPESSIGLLLYGKTTRIIPLDNGKFKTGIEFIRMPENCRTLLARQVMLLQSRQRQREMENYHINL